MHAVRECASYLVSARKTPHGQGRTEGGLFPRTNAPPTLASVIEDEATPTKISTQHLAPLDVHARSRHVTTVLKSLGTLAGSTASKVMYIDKRERKSCSFRPAAPKLTRCSAS